MFHHFGKQIHFIILVHCGCIRISFEKLAYLELLEIILLDYNVLHSKLHLEIEMLGC